MTKEARVVEFVELVVVTHPHKPNGAKLVGAYYATVSSA